MTHTIDCYIPYINKEQATALQDAFNVEARVAQVHLLQLHQEEGMPFIPLA